MSVETDHKALIRRYVEEILEGGNLDAVGRYFAPDCIDHTAPPGIPSGAAGIKALLGMTLAAFSDVRVTIDDLIAEGDTVVSRLTLRGRHTGEFMGMAPSEREIRAMQISIDRIAEGKIVEHWGLADQLALMEQLGG